MPNKYLSILFSTSLFSMNLVVRNINYNINIEKHFSFDGQFDFSKH